MAPGPASSGIGVEAVSGSEPLPAGSGVWSFWSSVISVLRLGPRAAWSAARVPFDRPGLYARSQEVMTRINVVCDLPNAAGIPRRHTASRLQASARGNHGYRGKWRERVVGWRPRTRDEPGGHVETAIFDADSHLMETPDWLGDFADQGVRDRLGPLGFAGAGTGAAELMASLPELWEAHRTQDIGPEVLSGPKGWMAPGALDAEVRSRVLDALGDRGPARLPDLRAGPVLPEQGPRPPLRGHRGAQPGHGGLLRADQRLKPVGFLPLDDPERAASVLDKALEEGVAAVWVPSDAPADFSPAHVDLEPGLGPPGRGGGALRAPRGRGEAAAQGIPQQRQATAEGLPGRRREPPVEGLPGPAPLAGALSLLHGARRGLRAAPGPPGAAIELGATWVPGLLAQRGPCVAVVLPVRAGARGPDALALGVPAPPGSLYAFPLRGHGVASRPVRPGDVHVLDRLPASRRWDGGRSRRSATRWRGFDEATRDRFFWRNGAELLGLV